MWAMTKKVFDGKVIYRTPQNVYVYYPESHDILLTTNEAQICLEDNVKVTNLLKALEDGFHSSTLQLLEAAKQAAEDVCAELDYVIEKVREL